MKRDDWMDADFDVISGPSPVEWQAKPEKPRDPWYRFVVPVILWIVAGYVLLLGFAGADLDTRDAVQDWKDRQPVPYTISAE